MNRLYNLSRNAALSAIAFVSMTFASEAQNLESRVLASVEKNNPELQALRKRTESEKYGFKAERMVEAPEVGFDYLWGSPADIGTRKDISVTQSIDIATISGTRGKIAKSESELSDMQFNVRPVFGYGLHGVSQAAVGDNSKHFCLHSATSLCIQYDCNT